MPARRRFRRPSHSTVVAYLALFVALGGTTAYAANTVFSTDIVDGQVKSVDIGDNEVATQDVKNGTIGSQDFNGLALVDMVLARSGNGAPGTGRIWTKRHTTQTPQDPVTLFDVPDVGIFTFECTRYDPQDFTGRPHRQLVYYPSQGASPVETWGSGSFIAVLDPSSGTDPELVPPIYREVGSGPDVWRFADVGELAAAAVTYRVVTAAHRVATLTLNANGGGSFFFPPGGGDPIYTSEPCHIAAQLIVSWRG